MAASRRAAQRARRRTVSVSEPGSGSMVRTERQGPVAVLTLDHPPVNVLTRPLLEDFATRIIGLTEDPSVRAIVIASALDGFSGGADIKAMVKMDRAEASAFSAEGHAVANLLECSPLPVIVAVNGFCFGGACELSQACDFIVASEDAVFGQPEIFIGVIPGWGGSRRLTRAVGVARARRWIMTGERIPARTACEWGLVDRVVPREKLLDQAMAVANQLSSLPALALAAAKYSVNQASDPSWLLGLEFERELWGLLFEHHDQREGMRAFLEKRPAVYTDRIARTGRRAEFPWEHAGSPWEIAKDQVLRMKRKTAGSPPARMGPNPFEIWERAEAHREAGMRAFEVFFAMMRHATESYRNWVQLMLLPSGTSEVSAAGSTNDADRTT